MYMTCHVVHLNLVKVWELRLTVCCHCTLGTLLTSKQNFKTITEKEDHNWQRILGTPMWSAAVPHN